MKSFALTDCGKYLWAAGLALLLTACGGGGGGGGGGGISGGGFSLSLTDAPVQDLALVCVTFTDVIIHPSDGSDDIHVDVTDGEDSPECRDAGPGSKTINLKSLSEGNSVLLVDDYPLPAGDYSWIRLVLDTDPANTYVVVDEGGAELMLDCSSCNQSHLKLNRSFNIEAEGWVAFTIDFDLRKSITLRNRNKPNPRDFDYKLRPTLRIVDTEVASSFIWGYVTDTRSEPVNPDDPSACAVYVYEGDVMPDDICITMDNQQAPVDCPSDGARPIMEADVMLDTNSGMYDYRTGFLYPGLYTVALVCEYDDPDNDDDLAYYDTSLVNTQAGSDGTRQDLELFDLAGLTLTALIAGGNPFSAAGDPVKLDFSVANTGNVGLDGPAAVSVSVPGVQYDADCPPDLAGVGDADTVLDPGEKVVCTYDYSVTQVDVNNGQVTFAATATVDGVTDSDEVQALLEEPQAP